MTPPSRSTALGDSSVPIERAADLTIPTLVLDGGVSLPFMHPSVVAVAGANPNGQQRTLEGHTYDVAGEVIAPVLATFFDAR